MNAEILLNALLSDDSINKEGIKSVFDTLPSDATVNDFRRAIIRQKLMTYTQVMAAFLNYELLPRSKSVLNRLEQKRNARTHFEPERHVHKFHVTENDQLAQQVLFDGNNIRVEIPEPNTSELTFASSDEQQAVVLAMEMAKMGEATEAEIILLETLDSFDTSHPAMKVLCWLYLCTDHAERVESWADLILQSVDDQIALELLTLAEQSQSKHLLAVAHFQKLLQLRKVKTVWYLLLAFSLEKTQCLKEAMDNYRIYITITQDKDLKLIAEKHLKELKES